MRISFKPMVSKVVLSTRMPLEVLTSRTINLVAFLSNAVVVVNNSTLSSALNNLNGAAGQANTVIGQLDGTMNNVQRDLGVLLQILGKDPSSGDRHVVSAILKQLIQDQGPALGFAAGLGDNALDTLVTNLNPTLDEIQSQLQDLSHAVGQVHTSLTAASGDFHQALGEVLSDANASQQFVQFAAADLTNRLATALGPAGDYFSADPNAAKQAIKQQLVTAFLGSALPASYQRTLKQFLFDDNAVLDELMDTLFDQINGAIRDGLSDQITDAQDGTLQAVKGLASGSFLSAKIRGAPTFNGDSLRKIHLDAAIQLNVPDPMNFNAYMEIEELDSQSVPLDCIPAGAAAAEVTLGAQNVKLDWGSLNPSGTPLTLSIAAKWTLQNGNVIGVGGSFDIKGKVGFEGCSVNELGAELAFGATENYFAAKAAGTITILGIPVDLQAGVFVGQACSLDPILFIDPEADRRPGRQRGRIRRHLRRVRRRVVALGNPLRRVRLPYRRRGDGGERGVLQRRPEQTTDRHAAEGFAGPVAALPVERRRRPDDVRLAHARRVGLRTGPGRLGANLRLDRAVSILHLRLQGHHRDRRREPRRHRLSR